MQNDKNLSNLPGRSALEQKARLLALTPAELLDEPVNNFVALPVLWTRFVDASPYSTAERYERLLAAIEIKVLPKSGDRNIGPLYHERDLLISLVRKMIAPACPDRDAVVNRTITHRCLAYMAASRGGATVGNTVWRARETEAGMEEDVVHALNKAKLPPLRFPLKKPYSPAPRPSGGGGNHRGRNHDNRGNGGRGNGQRIFDNGNRRRDRRPGRGRDSGNAPSRNTNGGGQRGKGNKPAPKPADNNTPTP